MIMKISVWCHQHSMQTFARWNIRRSTNVIEALVFGYWTLQDEKDISHQTTISSWNSSTARDQELINRIEDNQPENVVARKKLCRQIAKAFRVPMRFLAV